MNAATSVTATFALQTFVLTVTKSGSGTVTSSPAGIDCGATCSTSFTNGTVVSLTATPASGFNFAGWGGSCSGTGACSVTMSAARTVTAAFAVNSNTFTDNPLAAGTAVKAIHLTELRTAVNAARTRNGLAAAVWTDPTITARSTAVKAVHVAELRTALNQVFTALSRTLPTYTDPTLVAGQTVPKAAHIQELRNAVNTLP
jgi:hypothetical protein